MSDELDLEGTTPDEGGPPAEKPKPTPRRGGGRPPTAAVSGELKSSIKGSLDELAEWLDGRDQELAGTLRDSSPRIAEFLAVHAAKRARLKRGIQYVFARGGPFAGLRAFGPLARGIGDRLGAWRDERQADELEDDEPAPTGADDGGGQVLPHA